MIDYRVRDNVVYRDAVVPVARLRPADANPDQYSVVYYHSGEYIAWVRRVSKQWSVGGGKRRYNSLEAAVAATLEAEAVRLGYRGPTGSTPLAEKFKNLPKMRGSRRAVHKARVPGVRLGGGEVP